MTKETTRRDHEAETGRLLA